jgi:hypothetical protein
MLEKLRKTMNNDLLQKNNQKIKVGGDTLWLKLEMSLKPHP